MTAPTPFLLGDTVDFPGERPTIYPRSTNRFWLGRAGNMIELPAPSVGITKTPTQSETAHTLLSGGIAVTRALALKYQWDLSWPQLSQRDWAVIDGFYRRLFGNGPWCLVSPEEINYLGQGGSVGTEAGSGDGIQGWLSFPDNELSPDSFVLIPPAASMSWAANNGDFIIYGTNATGFKSGTPAADPTYSPVNIPGISVTFSVYVKNIGGSDVDLELTLAVVADDCVTLLDELGGSTETVVSGDDWRRITLTYVTSSGVDASGYLIPLISCSTDSSSILLTAPQLEYAPEASDWTTGTGAPRVLIPAGPVRAVNALLRTTPTMSLVEA